MSCCCACRDNTQADQIDFLDPEQLQAVRELQAQQPAADRPQELAPELAPLAGTMERFVCEGVAALSAPFLFPCLN